MQFNIAAGHHISSLWTGKERNGKIISQKMDPSSHLRKHRQSTDQDPSTKTIVGTRRKRRSRRKRKNGCLVKYKRSFTKQQQPQQHKM
jgi:hypothetical protein